MAQEQESHDEAYVGTIFSSKFTIFGAIIILFFLAIILYRHWALGVPFGMETQAAPMDAVLDTLK